MTTLNFDQIHSEQPGVDAERTIVVAGKTYSVAPRLTVAAVTAVAKLSKGEVADALPAVMRAIFGAAADDVAQHLATEDLNRIVTDFYGTSPGESSASPTS